MESSSQSKPNQQNKGKQTSKLKPNNGPRLPATGSDGYYG